MKSILFIANKDNENADNAKRLEHSFRICGWSTSLTSHQRIWLKNSTLWVMDDEEDMRQISDFDLIWLIGFGSKATFLDRMQLLQGVDPSKFVNSIHACLHFQNKATYGLTQLRQYLPTTYCIGDSELLRLVMSDDDTQYVAKPTAGSFGRDVYYLSHGDPNLYTILDHLVSQGFVLIQQRVDTTEEYRWMLVNGQVLGVYGKDKPNLRGNLNAGSTPREIQPPPEALKVAEEVARILALEGIRFCAVDIADGYVLDVNFINPGWFQSMQSLTGEDLSLQVPRLLEEF